MRAVVVVAIAALAACGFPPQPKMPAAAPLVAAPTTLSAKPLAVGQWATYRESVGGEVVGGVRFSVVEQAACGMWVQITLISRDPERRWRFCVAPDHTIAKATLDGEPVSIAEHARELAPLLTRVLPPSFAGKFVVEETHVPAGHFFGAVRLDGGTTTWLHPDVPLGAVVKVRQGDREDVLARYGDTEPTLGVLRSVEPEHCCRPPRYFELALGSGDLTGVGSGETGRLMVLGWSFGTVVTSTTDVVFSAMAGDSSQYSDTKNAASALLTATGGVRLSPFRLHAGAEAGLYCQAQLGYATLQKGDDDTVGNGIALVPAIGWLVSVGRDWSMGLQASDQMALLNRGVGFRQALDITVAIDLWLR